MRKEQFNHWNKVKDNDNNNDNDDNNKETGGNKEREE